MKKLILGVVLVVAATVLPIAFIVSAVSSLGGDTATFEAPGEKTVQVQEPGRYYVWNEFRTIHDGRSYDRSEALPHGATFSLEHVDSGTSPRFVVDGSISTSMGATERRSAGYFQIDEVGTHILRIDGLPEPRIFSFGPSIFARLFAFAGGMLLAILMAIAFTIGGIVLMVLGVIEVVRKRRQPLPMESLV